MIGRVSVVVLVVAAAALPAAAQWDLGLQLSTSHYRGTAHDTTNSAAENLRPGDATTIGLRLDHAIGRTRVALQAVYAKPGITATAPGLTVTDNTTGRLLEVGTLINFQVGGIGSSGAVRAELGPALHLWTIDDVTRTRVGALGAVLYEWPVATRFTGTIRLEGMLSKSWLDAADAPPEVERQATWRYGWGVGLRYRL